MLFESIILTRSPKRARSGRKMKREGPKKGFAGCLSTSWKGTHGWCGSRTTQQHIWIEYKIWWIPYLFKSSWWMCVRVCLKHERTITPPSSTDESSSPFSSKCDLTCFFWKIIMEKKFGFSFQVCELFMCGVTLHDWILSSEYNQRVYRHFEKSSHKF